MLRDTGLRPVPQHEVRIDKMQRQTSRFTTSHSSFRGTSASALVSKDVLRHPAPTLRDAPLRGAPQGEGCEEDVRPISLPATCDSLILSAPRSGAYRRMGSGVRALALRPFDTRASPATQGEGVWFLCA